MSFIQRLRERTQQIFTDAERRVQERRQQQVSPPPAPPQPETQRPAAISQLLRVAQPVADVMRPITERVEPIVRQIQDPPRIMRTTEEQADFERKQREAQRQTWIGRRMLPQIPERTGNVLQDTLGGIQAALDTPAMRAVQEPFVAISKGVGGVATGEIIPRRGETLREFYKRQPEIGRVVARELEKTGIPVLPIIGGLAAEMLLPPYGPRGVGRFADDIAKATTRGATKNILKKGIRGITDDEATVLARELTPIKDAGTIKTRIDDFVRTRQQTPTPPAPLANIRERAVRAVAPEVPPPPPPPPSSPITQRLTPKRPAPLGQVELPSPRETVPEFAVAKEQRQLRAVSERSKDVAHLFQRINPTADESRLLFDAMENPGRVDILTEELVEKGGQELVEKARGLNVFLTDEKVGRGLLQNAVDDDVYLKTILEGIDGSPASAEQLGRLKNAMGENFKEQLIYRQPIGKIAKEHRKYATADARDAVLRNFGLRTKRDFGASMSANIQLTARVTAKKDFQDALRGVSKNVQRMDIQEVYDPLNVKKFVSDTKQSFVREKDAILEKLRRNKLLADQEYDILKNRVHLALVDEKDYTRSFVDADTLEVQRQKMTDALRQAFRGLEDDTRMVISQARDQIAARKYILTEEASQAINKAREGMEQAINNYYGDIVVRRGKMIDEGWRDLGEIFVDGQPLRGIMVKDKDFRAVQELMRDVKPSSLEDASRVLKLFQATADLFQLPQALRSAFRINGLRGVKRWWDALIGVGARKLTIEQVVNAVEFTRPGKHVDFDIDIWDTLGKNMQNNESEIMKLIKRGKEKYPVIEKVGKPFDILTDYQFETLMTPLKINTFYDMVEMYARKNPNLPERDIKVMVGRAIDDGFAGQNYRRLMARNPTLFSQGAQRASNILIFSRDYLLTTLRQTGRETAGILKRGIEGDIDRKSLVRKVIWGLGAANALSYWINGHSTFENEDPNQWYRVKFGNFTDQRGNPYYIDTMGNLGQTWALINRPMDFIRGKVGGLGRTALSGLSGEGLEFEGLIPVPFSWQNISANIYSSISGGAHFGVASSLDEAAIIAGLETMGVSGAFSGGQARTSTIAKMIREGTITPLNFWNYVTGRPMETKAIEIKSQFDGLKTKDEKDLLWNQLVEAEVITPEISSQIKSAISRDNREMAEFIALRINKAGDKQEKETLWQYYYNKGELTEGVAERVRPLLNTPENIAQRINELRTPEEKTELWNEYVRNNILTPELAERVRPLLW